jgi:cytochrome c biogenesis protein ResB
VLLPERAQERFSAPEVEGRTMTIRVPGRILSADEDLTGTSPGLERLRWGVIVRDEGSCDLLGTGRPKRRFSVSDGSVPVTTGVGATGAGDLEVDREPGIPTWIWWVVAAMVGALVAFYVVRRRADDG